MFIAIIVGVFGLLIGSFLNVCIYRIPRGESIVFPASHCMGCGHVLGVWDLVPVVSFLGLGGKCRYCGDRVSLQYPIVEFVNGLLYFVVVYRFGFGVSAIVYCLFISIMVVLTMIDLRHMILPTKVIIFGGIVALVGRIIPLFSSGDFETLKNAIFGGIVGYSFLAIPFYICIYIFKKEGLGFGDVRYLGMIGLFTSPGLVLLTVFIAAIVGSIYGGVQLWIRKASEAFPFGPFLTAGAMVSLFYGEKILGWYLECS